MDQRFSSNFVNALFEPAAPVPTGLVSQGSDPLRERFGVYRNNVMIGLVNALEARFPATRRIVGDEFFTAMAAVFARENPPCTALMMFYGEGFPDFIADFEAVASIPYLADVARLEAARTRAYHAVDAIPLGPDALASVAPEALPMLRFALHPSFEIVASEFPIVTIWSMNTGETELGPITDWTGETALIVRPRLDVEVRRLPPGGRKFLSKVIVGLPLATAAEATLAERPDFDLSAALAAFFGAGLVVALLQGEA
jgi:hypothetical protein